MKSLWIFLGINFDFLVRIEPFQGLARTPWGHFLFPPQSSRSGSADRPAAVDPLGAVEPVERLDERCGRPDVAAADRFAGAPHRQPRRWIGMAQAVRSFRRCLSEEYAPDSPACQENGDFSEIRSRCSDPSSRRFSSTPERVVVEERRGRLVAGLLEAFRTERGEAFAAQDVGEPGVADANHDRR